MNFQCAFMRLHEVENKELLSVIKDPYAYNFVHLLIGVSIWTTIISNALKEHRSIAINLRHIMGSNYKKL